MESLYDVIIRVTNYPEIYLGKPSLERLYAFIGGYLEARPEADDHCLDGFNKFVSEIYSISSDHNWASIIGFFSYSEKDAFDKFKEHFMDYQQTRNT